MDFGGVDYEVLPPEQFFYDYLNFATKGLPQDRFELKAMGFVGKMGSGKSNSMRFVVKYLQDIYGDDINIVMADALHIALENLTKHKLQAIILDDAVSRGQDSRRSMSNVNVQASQMFFEIRHECERVAGNGVVFVLMGYQGMTAVDVRYRENFDFLVFKSFYNNEKLKKILNQDERAIDLLQHMTKQSVMYHDYSARGIGVMVASWGDLIYFNFPEVKSEELKYTILTEKGKRDQIKEDTVQWLANSPYLAEGLKKDILYGLMKRRLGDDYEKYWFLGADFTEMYRDASAKKYLQDLSERGQELAAARARAKAKRELTRETIVRLVDEGVMVRKPDRDTFHGLVIKVLGKDFEEYGFTSKDVRRMYRLAKAEAFGREIDPSANPIAWDGMQKIFPAILKGVGGFTYQEIEDRFGISSSSAHRAFHRLKETLASLAPRGDE
jgi:hypothetical protein